MEKDIGKINKNDQTDIVVRVDDFGGKAGLTIREFVTSDRYTGFTKAGVRISAENFPKFKEMINSISEADLQAPESEEGSEENQPKEQKKLDESENVQIEKPGKSSEDELPDY
ncbi:MAG: hypothetical protein ACOC1P_03590 [Minisyncoccales bacterium]